MKGSSRKDLAVYDFDEAEEAVEAASGKMMSRFMSKLKPSEQEALNKYTFLQAFTSGLTDEHKDMNVTNVSCIDLPDKDDDDVSYSLDTPERNLVSAEEASVLDGIMLSSSYDYSHNTFQDESQHRKLLRADTLVVGASSFAAPSLGSNLFSELPLNRKLGDAISDENESCSSLSRSPSTPSSDLAENEGYLENPVLANCRPAFEDMDNVDSAVIIYPDHVVFENATYGDCRLTFLSDCVKLQCVDPMRNDEKVLLEWPINDVIHIGCCWSESVGTALIMFLLPASECKMEKASVASDTMKITLVVTDDYWLEKEQKIMSLAVRYRDIWNACSSDDLLCEDDSMVPSMWFSKSYYTETVGQFEVVYPSGDPDAVTLSKRDIELLQPDTFINDTIIDFYIKYLQNKIQPTEKHRFHFFNSFFFRKLADLDKDPGCSSEGRAAFLRVRKWTRKVNIFEKDFIFIPVNFNLHWSLLVICHPGEVVNFEDADTKDSAKVPCILHMDSIKGSHSGVKNIVQSYLCEEWKEKHPESSGDDASRFSNLRFVSLELPQQENSFDCGLFLLHYVELFLEEAPVCFNPFRMTQHSSFLSADWFFPAEASVKRCFIWKLIYQLLKESSQNVIPDTCINSHLSTEIQETVAGQEPVELICGQYSETKTVDGNSASPHADGNSESRIFTMLPTTTQCDEVGFSMHEFLDPGGVASSLESKMHLFPQILSSGRTKCTATHLEESTEAIEQFVSQCSATDICHPSSGKPTAQICSTSSPVKHVEAESSSCSSRKGKEDGISSPAPCRGDDDASSQKGKVENLVLSSQKNYGFVSDSSTSTSSDKPESSVEDSKSIGASMGRNGDGDGDDIQEAEVDKVETEDSARDREGNTITAAVQNPKDSHLSDASTPEGDKKDQHINNRENVINKDCEVDPAKSKLGEQDPLDPPSHPESPPTSSCQVIELIVDENSPNKDEGRPTKRSSETGTRAEQEHHKPGQDPSDPPSHQDTPPTSSCQVIIVDENSPIKDEGRSTKRSFEIGTKAEQQSNKRQKAIILHQGFRRRTRSFVRDQWP